MNGVQIVAVGASLGGLKTFALLLQKLPSQFRAPLVLVQHRRADGDGHLAELLGSNCSCEVVEPEDRVPLEGGRVYVAPGGYHLLVDRSSFWLSVDPPVWFARPSIDVLFESVADAFGPAALAVVLTGASEDGAAGARAVKAAGGRVLVQDPQSAESPVAPRAVLAQTPVDGVLSVEEIAAIVVRAVG